MDYEARIRALLGDRVDTQLTPLTAHAVFQHVVGLDMANPHETVAQVVRDIDEEMQRHGFTRVNPTIRVTARYLDLNCLVA